LAPAPRAKRVQPHLAAGREGDRLNPERPCQRPILALDIEHPRLATEDRLAVDVGLDEARLARGKAAEHQHVRTRQVGRVERPGGTAPGPRRGGRGGWGRGGRGAPPGGGGGNPPGGGRWSRRGPAALPPAVSPQPPAERQGEWEPGVLLAVEPLQAQAGEL